MTNSITNLLQEIISEDESLIKNTKPYSSVLINTKKNPTSRKWKKWELYANLLGNIPQLAGPKPVITDDGIWIWKTQGFTITVFKSSNILIQGSPNVDKELLKAIERTIYSKRSYR